MHHGEFQKSGMPEWFFGASNVAMPEKRQAQSRSAHLKTLKISFRSFGIRKGITRAGRRSDSDCAIPRAIVIRHGILESF